MLFISCHKNELLKIIKLLHLIDQTTEIASYFNILIKCVCDNNTFIKQQGPHLAFKVEGAEFKAVARTFQRRRQNTKKAIASRANENFLCFFCIFGYNRTKTVKMQWRAKRAKNFKENNVKFEHFQVKLHFFTKCWGDKRYCVPPAKMRSLKQLV